MKELLERVAKCAPKELKAKLNKHGVLTVEHSGGTEYERIYSDGSTVQNASGLMVLIECMKGENQRLALKSGTLTDADMKRYWALQDFLTDHISNLSTQSVCDAFCEVFE